MNPRATSELLSLCSHGDIVVGTINAGPTAPPPRRKWMGFTWRSGEGVPQSWREVSIHLRGGVPAKDGEENTDSKLSSLLSRSTHCSQVL